ncbi:unnamed protein product, partial [Polarella glacialis]
AWTAMGLSAGEMITDLFGGTASGQAASSPVRFHVPSVRQDGDTVTSMTWWTRECIEAGTSESEREKRSEDDDCSSPGSQRHYLILGSLSGRLVIMDVLHQNEVRIFSLAPIVWLQRCQSHCQEWLLIETTADPKHWKLLLAAIIERPAPRRPSSWGTDARSVESEQLSRRPVVWSITDGLALPTASSEHFELEPLNGLPPLYQLLVLRRGRGGDGQSSGHSDAVEDSDMKGGKGRRTPMSEVLGMLVDDQTLVTSEEQKQMPLCLMLSLPSFPEEPLARIDLPLAAAPPGAPGRRRLADLALILGGGLVLSIVHVAGDNKARASPGSDQSSRIILTTAKPCPFAAGAANRTESGNIVVQEFSVPGRAVGAVAGYASWPGGAGTNCDFLAGTRSARTSRERGQPAAAAGWAPVEDTAFGLDRGWTTLAVVWTPTQIFVLTASAESICETLQLASISALAPMHGPKPMQLERTSPDHQPLHTTETAPALSDPELKAAGDPGKSAPRADPAPGEQFEAALPLLCWAFDVDIDALMLDAGRRALFGRWDETGEQAVRSALQLWARRSSRVVPLHLLVECFSELAQHVEVVCSLAPAILQVLMPHWPRIASEMNALRFEDLSVHRETKVPSTGGVAAPSDVERSKPTPDAMTALMVSEGKHPQKNAVLADMDASSLKTDSPPHHIRASGELEDDPASPSGPPSPSPSQEDTDDDSTDAQNHVGPSAVAWFLSLAVMLLVVLNPKVSKSGSNEYKRGERNAQPSKGISGISGSAVEWQAWVSKQVSLLLSGAKGKPPNSFAQLADGVQHDFDVWWSQQLQEARTATAWCNILAPALVDADSLAGRGMLCKTLVNAESDQPSPKAVVAQGTQDVLQESVSVQGWTARLLLLCINHQQWAFTAGDGDGDGPKGVTSLALWTMRNQPASSGLVSVCTLISMMMRGLLLTVSRSSDGSIKPCCFELPASPDLGLAAAFSILTVFTTEAEQDKATEVSYRVLWSVLRAVLGHAQAQTGHKDEQKSPLSLTGTMMGLSVSSTSELSPFLSVEHQILDSPVFTTSGVSVDRQGFGKRDLSYRQPVEPSLFAGEPVSLSPVACADMEHCRSESDQLWAPWAQLLNGLNKFLDSRGRCVECATSWSWEEDVDICSSLCATDPLLVDSLSLPDASAISATGVSILLALEEHLMQKSDLVSSKWPSVAAARLPEGMGEHEPAKSQNTQRHAVWELAEKVAIFEDVRTDTGERLSKAAWWPGLRSQCPAATSSLVLAVMATEHPWIWELPWTGRFRLHLVHALFAVKEAALASKSV